MSPNVKQAFDEWIKVEWWHKGNPQDEARFFRFVWAVCTVSRRPLTASDLRREILHEWNGRLEIEYLESCVMHYSQLCETLCNFAKARKAKRLFLLDDSGMPNNSFKGRRLG